MPQNVNFWYQIWDAFKGVKELCSKKILRSCTTGKILSGVNAISSFYPDANGRSILHWKGCTIWSIFSKLLASSAKRPVRKFSHDELPPPARGAFRCGRWRVRDAPQWMIIGLLVIKRPEGHGSSDFLCHWAQIRSWMWPRLWGGRSDLGGHENECFRQHAHGYQINWGH